MNSPYKTTFVTACFNCNKNQFFINKYLKKSLRTITIECPLVIYCEEEHADIFRTIRRLFNLDHITHVIPVKMEELFFYQYKHHLLRGEDLATNYNKNAHIVMMNKFKFLQEAIQENRFSTTHTAWIDVNLLEKNFNDSANYLDINIYDKIAHICANPRDKFTIELINHWMPSWYSDLNAFYSRYQWIVAGCFFTMENMTGLVVLDKLIAKAVEITMQGFGSGEESFFSFVIDDDPDLFNLYVGDYQDTIHNYYRIEKNHNYVNWVVDKWKHSGRESIYRNIQRTIGA